MIEKKGIIFDVYSSNDDHFQSFIHSRLGENKMNSLYSKREISQHEKTKNKPHQQQQSMTLNI